MIPDALLKLRESVGNIVEGDKKLNSLIQEGNVYKITISIKGIGLTAHRLLKKRKKPNFTKEETERRNLLRTAIRDKTGAIFISGLVLQLIKEIKKHRLAKFDERTQGALNPLYVKVAEILEKEVYDVDKGQGRIERKRGRLIEAPK